MKKLLFAFLLFCGQLRAADYDKCIKYYVRNTCVSFEAVCSSEPDPQAQPWALMATDKGIQFIKWDATILGTNQPSIAVIESLDAAAKDWFIQRKQAAKPAELKQCENNFLLLCEQLTGKRDKVGFDTLRTIIEAMLQTDPQTAMVLSLKLLSIDAEGKRFSATWWDSCAWHNE
ncbi:MAG: hypothetical protein WC736_15255 [Gallionella sp.]|jgi:hypothetical protein